MIATVLTVSTVVLGAAAARPRILPGRTLGVAASDRSLRRLLPPSLRRRPPAPGDDEVADWCEQVARSVRAGSSLAHAVIQAGAAAPAAGAAFDPVVRAINHGRGLADGLDELADRDPASAPGLVVPVLAACAELGGPAAMPLERVAATLHARSAERSERRANSAQARLSARVMTTVPVGVLALLALAEPAVRSSLASPAGVACLAVGGLFNVAGWCWMRRVIGGAR